MSDSGSGSEVEEEYEVEAIINDRSEGNKIFLSNHSIMPKYLTRVELDNPGRRSRTGII